jgi:hypothetical protein
MLKFISIILLSCVFVGCQQKAKIITKCYIETESKIVKDTIYCANPDTTWLNDSVFIITILSRDTVTKHINTIYTKSSEINYYIRLIND